jgi:hypothetical protein
MTKTPKARVTKPRRSPSLKGKILP